MLARTVPEPVNCSVTVVEPLAPALAYQISTSSPWASALLPATLVQVLPRLSVTLEMVLPPTASSAKTPTRVLPAETPFWNEPACVVPGVGVRVTDWRRLGPGVMAADAVDCDPVPTAFVAATRKVYAVPLVSPVTAKVVAVVPVTIAVCAVVPMNGVIV